MELGNRTAIVYVNEQGFLELKSLLGIDSSLQGSVCQVLETDGFGIWMSLSVDPRRIVGLPWQYLRAIELEQDLIEPAAPPGKKRMGF